MRTRKLTQSRGALTLLGLTVIALYAYLPRPKANYCQICAFAGISCEDHLWRDQYTLACLNSEYPGLNTNNPGALYIGCPTTVDARAYVTPCDTGTPSYTLRAEAHGTLKAIEMLPEGGDAQSWSITIDDPSKEGEVTVTAESSYGNAKKDSDGTCGQFTVSAMATIIYKPGSGCSSCSSASPAFATGDTSVGSMDFKIFLGQTPYGTRAGFLELQADSPSPALAQPAGLTLPMLENNVTLITNSSGVIEQVLTTQGLVNVASIDSYDYVVQCFYASAVGSMNNGLYTTNAPAFSTWFISNPDGAAADNRLWITNIQNGVTSVYQYTYTASSLRWDLVKPDGQVDSVWQVAVPGNSEYTNYFEQVTANGQTLMQSEKTYEYIPSINCNLLTQLVEGTGSQTRTTTYTYYTSGTSANLVQEINYWNGNWVYYVYDDYGRKQTEYSAYGNYPPPANDAQPSPPTDICKETDYTYSSVPDFNNLQNPAAYTPYSTIVSLPARQQGGSWAMEPVSVTYDDVLDQNNEQSDFITRQDPSGDLNSERVVSLGADFTMGRPLLIQHEDGTSISYSYPNQFTAIENDPDGTQKTTLFDIWGNPIAFTNVETTTTPPVILGQTLYTYTNSSGEAYDELRRSHDETDLAGRKSEYRWYDCCGISAETNADGATTLYTYDVLNRRVAATVYYGPGAGVETTNVLDALGRVLVSERIGSDSSAIVLGKKEYDILGNIISQTNALGGVTSTAYSVVNSQLQVTTTYPNGGTRIDLYYRDGRLQSTTGTGVHGTQYTYDVEQDPNSGYWREVTTETKLDSNGNPTSEWTKTLFDGFGRAYLTLYAAASAPYPSTQSFFNSYGRLWKKVDPDGDVTFYTYYDSSSDINQSKQAFTVLAEDPGTQGIADYSTLVSDLGQTSFLGGIDRITLQHESVVPASGDAPDLVQTSTYAWTNSETDLAGTLVSSNATATTGLTNWAALFRDPTTPVVSQNRTTYYGSGTGHSVTSIGPDGAYTINGFSYGRLNLSTRYDSTGQQIAQTSYTYDAHGRQYQTTDARDGATTYGYNSADQVNSVITPNPGGLGGLPQTTMTYYNPMLQATNVLNPDGTSVTNIYLLTGELGQTSGSRTYPVAYTYDYAGRMKTMQTWQAYPNSGSAITTWNYDPYRGFLSGKTYNDGNGPTYGYTAAGRLQTRTWARGVTTTYGYENAGALATVSYSDTTPGVTYTYDRLGRRVGVVQNGVTTSLSYNLAGLETSEAYSGGSLDGLAVTNGFDTLLRRTNLAALSVSAPLVQDAFAYDHASRLQTVTDNSAATAYSANYSYLANSPLVSQIVFQQGATARMTTSKTYDFLNRLTEISSAPSGASNVSFAYSYNNANQRVVTRLADGSYWRYQYDSLGQVISGHKYFSDETPVPGQQFDYAFDTIGNRTQTKRGGDSAGANQRVANYSANLLNQYTSRTVPGYVDIMGLAYATNPVTVNGYTAWRKGEYFREELIVANGSAPVWEGVTVSASGQTTVNGSQFVPQTPESFAYDLDGNLTSDGRWNYGWDAENRLVSLAARTSVGPGISLKFEYDAKGRRIRKQVWPNTNWNGSSTNDTRFLYDGWNLISEVTSAYSPVRSYLWGMDLSGSSQGAGGIGGLLEVVYYGSTTTNSFVAFDGNGNVSALVNAADGTLIGQYEYGPFGEVVRATGPMAKANPFRFSTKYQDDETDLLYYGFRYYDACPGRWNARDPISERGGDDVYAMRHNDFLNLIDRLGKQAVSAPGGWTGSGVWTGPIDIGGGVNGPTGGGSMPVAGQTDGPPYPIPFPPGSYAVTLSIGITVAGPTGEKPGGGDEGPITPPGTGISTGPKWLIMWDGAPAGTTCRMAYNCGVKCSCSWGKLSAAEWPRPGKYIYGVVKSAPVIGADGQQLQDEQGNYEWKGAKCQLSASSLNSAQADCAASIPPGICNATVTVSAH